MRNKTKSKEVTRVEFFKGDSFCPSIRTTFPPGSMYLSLCHESTDEPDKVLKVKIVRHVCPKFSMCEKDLRQFLVRPSVGSIFTNSCFWTAVHLRKDKEQIQRIIHHVEVDNMQTAPKRCRRRILVPKMVNLTACPNIWIGLKVVRDTARCLTSRFRSNYSEKCSLQRFRLVSWWKMSTTSTSSRHVGKSTISLLCLDSRNTASSTKSQENSVEFEWRIYAP